MVSLIRDATSNGNLLNFSNGIHLPFLELSIIILVVSRWELKVGQPTLYKDIVQYWWQRPIIFGSCRIRVKFEQGAVKEHKTADMFFTEPKYFKQMYIIYNVGLSQTQATSSTSHQYYSLLKVNKRKFRNLSVAWY